MDKVAVKITNDNFKCPFIDESSLISIFCNGIPYLGHDFWKVISGLENDL